mmetsp:Transcript_6379/g.17776  ORF Transcript_6379/g.17776 Transcript_6379/m.17776 type:complete len:230 (+) Transcript_6379:262-951(+)
MRLNLPDSPSSPKIRFSRKSISCVLLATSVRDASFSADASCFVASASHIIFCIFQVPSMIISSSLTSAVIRSATEVASAFAISPIRYVSREVLVLWSLLSSSLCFTSPLISAAIIETFPDSSTFTLCCSNSSSARLLRPFSPTSTCSVFLLISSISISEFCLICITSNSVRRATFSIDFSCFVVCSKHCASLAGSQTAVIFTSLNRTPESSNCWFNIFKIMSARSPRKP